MPVGDSVILRRALAVDAGVWGTPDIFGSGSLPAEGSPIFADRAKGPYLWSAAGEQILDLLLNFGAVSIGHANDVVDSAVIEQLRRGVSRTLRTTIHLELIEILIEMVPHAEMALIVRSGSDATSAAVRLARAFTRRDVVLSWGYHGWHDWSAPRVAGIPEESRRLVHKVGYNDPSELAATFERYGDEIACLIMMPFEIARPRSGFLELCRELCDKAGALLIFDELRSGFRVAPGGAQELFRVRADLVALGKAMANGYALAAVTGRRDVLRESRHTSLNSTFFRSADGVAAGIATLRFLQDAEAHRRMWKLGERLQNGLERAASRQRVKAVATGLPPMPFHEIHLGDDVDEQAAQQVFAAGALQGGVLFHPRHHWFLCHEMDESHVDKAVRAAEVGYAAVRDWVESGAKTAEPGRPVSRVESS